jgi:magnesium transporter
MNFQLTEEFIESVELLIDQNNNTQLIQKFNNCLAPDIAEILRALDFEKCKYLFSLFNDELSADIIIELEDHLRERLLNHLSSTEIVEDFIDNLDSDDAADVIQELPKYKQKEVLSKIANPKQASDLADLLSYEDSSAGALMATELIKVYEDWSILRCVSEMRQQAQNVHKVYTIYVVNKNNELIGTVSLKKLLLTPEKTFISDIYKR